MGSIRVLIADDNLVLCSFIDRPEHRNLRRHEIVFMKMAARNGDRFALGGAGL